MAELSGLDMVREIIGQINNLRRLVTINGKKYKWDGKKYVRAVDGKTFTKKELVSFVKDERFRAPGTDNPRKDPSRPQKQNLGDRLKSKTKSVTSNIKKTSSQALNQGNKLLQNAKLRIGKPNPTSTKTNALKMNKYMRPNVTGKKGIVNAIGQAVANPLVDQLVDRLGRNISGNQKMSLKDYRAMKDQRLENAPNTLKTIGMHRDASKPQRVIGGRGRTTGWIQPEQTGGAIGRSRQDPYLNRPTPTPTPKKEEPKKEVKVNKKKNKSSVGKVMGDYAGSYNETKSKKKDKKKKNDPLKIHGKNPSSIQKKLLKAGFTTKELEDLVTAYNEKYRNKRGW